MGRTSTPIDQLDDSAVRTLLSSVSALSAHDFADDAKPDKTGLDKPRGKVRVKTTKGEHTILVGNNQRDDFWVKRADKPQVYLVKRYTADNLLKRPIDYRNKAVLSFKADDVVSLTLTKREAKGKTSRVKLTPKGGAWLGDGGALKDSSKVKTAVTALSKLKADAFAKHDAATLGMDKPKWTVEIKLKDRTVHRLAVGGVDKDGFFGVQRAGHEELFALRKYNLDKFLLEPDNYKPKK